MKVLFYPVPLADGQRVAKYLKCLGVPWTNDLNDPQVTHIHHYTGSNRIDEIDKGIKGRTINVNPHPFNIKKDRLDDIHDEVFGYGLRVNPAKHRGTCLVRSTQNAIHMARFVQCPIEGHMIDNRVSISKRGEPHRRIYVRLIDTRVDEKTIRDYRVVVMGGEIKLVYEKFIPSQYMFHVPREAEVKVQEHCNPEKIFSTTEIDNISLFVHRTKLDFSELDVLRNNSDGKIYIVDQNPMPAGPVLRHCQQPDKVLSYLSNCYKETYLL